MTRPKKYLNAKWLTICLDDKDINYLDDHRGKVTRGDYLKESMYALKGEHSQDLKNSIDKIKLLSVENHELKRQLMFTQSKIRNAKTAKPDVDIILNDWWEKYGDSIKEALTKRQEPNYDNLVRVSVLNYPDFPFTNPKDLRGFCIWKIQNNGGGIKV